MSQRPTIIHGPEDGIWCAWLGHPVRYLALGEQTNGNYCLSTAPVSKGHGAPPHSHSFDEGFYVLDGEVEFTAGRTTVILKKGEFIHISGGTAHKPKVISERAELLTIATPPGFDRFQLQAGERLANQDSQPSRSTSDIRSAIESIAPDFGIDMNPAEDALDVEPKIHVSRLGDGDLVDAVGDRYRFLVEAEQTDGRYAIWHATVGPGGGPPMHRHGREEEAFLVLDGELMFESDGEVARGGRGTFVNLPAGSMHRFQNESDRPAEMLILVSPAGLEEMFRQTGSIVTDTQASVAKPDAAEIARLHQIAPQFGISFE